MISALLVSLAVSAAPAALQAPTTTAVTALPPGAVTATITPTNCGQLRIDYTNHTTGTLRIEWTGAQGAEPPGAIPAGVTSRTILFGTIGQTYRYGAHVWDPTTGAESTVFGVVTMPPCLNEAPVRPVTLIPPETAHRRVALVRIGALHWKRWWL